MFSIENVFINEDVHAPAQFIRCRKTVYIYSINVSCLSNNNQLGLKLSRLYIIESQTTFLTSPSSFTDAMLCFKSPFTSLA